MNSRLRLIGITDPSLGSLNELETACRMVLSAGLPALMLRDNTPTTTDRQLIPLGHSLMGAARAAGSLLIVNRRLGLAAAIGARAIQLGKEGPTIAEARDALGPQVLVGYSAHSDAEAREAFEKSADYVILSPIFETPSKLDILPSIGLEPLRLLCRTAPGPVIALGGINPSNIAMVLATGAAGVAAIRAVFAGDPPANVRLLNTRIKDSQPLRG